MRLFCTQRCVLRATCVKNSVRAVRLEVASVLDLQRLVPISQQIGASSGCLLAGCLFMRVAWHRRKFRSAQYLSPRMRRSSTHPSPFKGDGRASDVCDWRLGGDGVALAAAEIAPVFPHPHPAPPLEGVGGAIPAIALPTLKRMTNSACAAVRISPSCPCPASSTARDPGQRQRECHRHL